MTDALLLKNHITVPYLPILGPVHPESITTKLITDLFCVGPTGNLLPYDKDCRWYSHKAEKLLLEHALHLKNGLILPTYNSATRRIKLYCYGDVKKSDVTFLSKKIQLQGTHISVITYNQPIFADSSSVAVFLKNLKQSDMQDKCENIEILKQTNAKDLMALAVNPENEGFLFLSKRYGDGKLGPIFVSRRNGVLAGAIGPIDITKDSLGKNCCLPPYIGVVKQQRCKGVATKLWMSAMNYAAQKGAEYLILQAETDEPSEFFYSKLGLKNLGRVFTGVIS